MEHKTAQKLTSPSPKFYSDSSSSRLITWEFGSRSAVYKQRVAFSSLRHGQNTEYGLPPFPSILISFLPENTTKRQSTRPTRAAATSFKNEDDFDAIQDDDAVEDEDVDMDGGSEDR